MIYRKLLKLGSGYNEKVGTSEIVQVAVEGVDQLETYFGAYLLFQFFMPCWLRSLFCRAELCQHRKRRCAACLRSLIPAAIAGFSGGQKAAVETLGAIHRPRRHLP